jgi:hypothetical protein
MPGGGMPGPKPDNYLVWAILSTILCCLPAGIVSIVYAAKVDGLYTGGQYAEAVQASENAKKWAIIAAVAGLVVAAGYVLFFVLIGIGASTS